MSWTVTKTQSLFDALKEFNPESSNTTIRSWISEKRVRIDQASVAHGKQVVYEGQKISLGAKKQYIDEGIEVLFEDDEIIALYKPAGILSVATDHDPLNNVHAFLKKRFKRRVYPVHRLDREASGVMIFAYTKNGQEILKKQFEEHSIFRQYLAVVEGSILTNTGTWQSYLYEDGVYFVRTTTEPGKGQLATTHYKVVKQKYGTSTLIVTLETGRKNQIRVHCKEAGHPILGDKKYSSGFEFGGRIALHAFKLGIQHPTLQKPMTFERAPGPEFAQFLP